LRIVDLEIQGAPSNLTYYYEGIAWFYFKNPDIALDAINKTVPLRSSSSFSMVFAVLFYRLMLGSETEVDLAERLRLKLYMVKGISKLLE
jgi:hypothetical protein